MAKMSWLSWFAYTLLVVGGINWGLVLFDVNLLAYLPSWLEKTAYGLVGLAGVYGLWGWWYITKRN